MLLYVTLVTSVTFVTHATSVTYSISKFHYSKYISTGLFINFPNFKMKGIISKGDIYLNAIPAKQSILHNVDCSKGPTLKVDLDLATDSFCRNMKQFV